jgi:hypothetical protein
MLRKALCHSGGGAKGISTLPLLNKFEIESGKKLCDEYDLLIGSSVGSINLSIIATGKLSIKELMGIYPEMLKKVFKPRFGFGFPKYDRKNFINVWNDVIGKNFKFGDVKTKLMISSVDLVTDTNHFFKSWHDDDAECNLLDFVLYSFSAPIYFGHSVDKKRQCVWSDGGVGYANLPLMECKTQIESFRWYDFEDEVDDETTNKVLIDAVGCLYHKNKDTFKNVSRDRWLKQALDFIQPTEGGLARSQSRMDQVRMMQYISSKNSNIKFRYWDCEIPEKMDKLDGLKFIDDYKQYGLEMAKKPLIES